nr:Gfo/Idh/MocA family oxidoreductase [Rhodococcus sp. (in: high G+C Gram-positive bacteria)]
MERLRIGILGASRIAEAAIVKPAHELGHRLVAVAARDRSRAESFAKKYGVERVLDTYDAVVEDPEVDVVYNPLANAFHARWNLAAVHAGKPVLTEKPFARNAVEAEDVRNAALELGVPILEGFHYLFHPITLRMFDVVACGTIGELRRVEVVMRMPSPGDDDPRWRYDLAGGSGMDLGCYGIHVLRQVGKRLAGGDPKLIEAKAVERLDRVDESFDLQVEFPSGATGSVETSMVADKYDMSFRLIGTRGEVFAPDYALQYGDDRVVTTTEHGSTVEHLGTRSTYTYQLDAFAQHLQNGAAMPFGLDDAVANMAFIDAAYVATGLGTR